MLLVTNGAMWIIYHIEHPFFERYKINHDPWPWYENRTEWDDLLWKSIKLVAVNACIIVPLINLVNLMVNDWEVKMSFEVEELPDTVMLMATIAFLMICEDFAFHWLHKLLHTKWLYAHVHKVHHTHKTTVGIAAEYSHPIDFIFSSIFPSALGVILLGKHIHFYTFILWGIIRIGETLDGHSGYEFSWSPYRLIPFSSSARYHGFHHSHNIGNYSSFFSFWDTICGTNKVYY